MIWAGWRLHRARIGGLAILLALLLAGLVVTAPMTVEIRRTGVSLLSAWVFLPFLVLLLFPGAAAAAVAPSVSTELSDATWKLAWTQSRTRLAWLGVRALLFAAVGVAAGAVSSLAIAWFGSVTGWVGTGWAALDFTGVAPVGFAVLGTAVGLAAAAVLRQPWPATTAALAVTFGLRFLVPWSILHLMPPTQGGLLVPAGSFSVGGSYAHSFYLPANAYPSFQALDLTIGLALSACLVAIAFAAVGRTGRSSS